MLLSDCYWIYQKPYVTIKIAFSLYGKSVWEVTMHYTLGIMAAGVGSRFKNGIKQLMPVGLHDEVLMEYAIFDALEAGFDHIVFIIRKELEQEFREGIGDKLTGRCKVDYAFQDLHDLPEGFTCPEGRTKPWGTGQAVLAAKGLIDGPFTVINADDYYGKQTFRDMYRLLKEMEEGRSRKEPDTVPVYYMPGFRLINTVTEHGSVKRGICTIEDGYLESITETMGIELRDGQIYVGDEIYDPQSLVSMNMWGLDTAFMNLLEERFVDFLDTHMDEEGSEYLLPTIIGGLLEDEKVRIQVYETDAKWFGMTYHEDTVMVKEEIKRMTAAGDYPSPLF